MVGLDERTYHTFLTDPGSKIKTFPGYNDIITRSNPINDGVFDAASKSEKPLVLEMDSFDLEKAPTWFKLNYAAGAKEILIEMLPGDAKPKHTLLLFSDKTNSLMKVHFK